MRRLLLVGLLLLTAVTRAHGQTPTTKLAWDQDEPLATVQAMQTTLKIDANAASVIVPTCTVKGTGSTCVTAPLPALASGTHTFTVTVFNAMGSASASLTGTPPTALKNFTITVTITIP